MTTTNKPTPTERRNAALSVECPKCGRGKRTPCRSVRISYQHGIVELTTPHVERVELGFQTIAENGK